MHLRVKLYGCGNDNEVELPVTAFKHHSIILKNADAAGAESPEFLLYGETGRLWIAGADEPGFALLFQTQEGAVMRRGKTPPANEPNSDGSLHTILSLGKS